MHRAIPEFRVEDVLVEAEHGACHNDVSQGDALANKVSVVQEVFIERGHGLLDVLLGAVGVGLVKLHNAETGEDPGAGSGEYVSVGEVEPLEDLGLGDGILASAKLIVGYVVGDGVALEQAQTIIAFKGRYLLS